MVTISFADLFVGGYEGTADRAHPGEVGRTTSCSSDILKASAQGQDGALVRSHPSYEGHPVADLFSLCDGSPVVAHHGVAEPFEHFGGLVALLLRVDHVGFRKDEQRPAMDAAFPARRRLSPTSSMS